MFIILGGYKLSEDTIDKTELAQIIRERVIEYREQAELADENGNQKLKSFYNGSKYGLIDLYKTLIG